MQNKIDLLNKIDELNLAAVEAGKDADMLDIMCLPLKTAIENYFINDYSTPITTCIKALGHGLFRQNVIYEEQSTTASFEPPTGWNDLREIFSVGDDLIIISSNDYIDSIEEVTSTTSTTDTTSATHYESVLITEETEVFSKAYSVINTQLATIAATANGLCLGNALQSMFEPPVIVSVPSMDDIAETIYNSKHYKDVIKFYGLNVFVPKVVES